MATFYGNKIVTDGLVLALDAGDSNSYPGSDPYFSNVSLLLHMDGSNGSTTFTDSSSNALSVTANGGAQISTAQSKFGGASGAFNGTAGNLTIPYNNAFDFGTGDFTVEGWFYFANLASPAIQTLIMLGDGANGSGPVTNGWALLYRPTGQISLYSYDGTNEYQYSTSGLSLTPNTWYFVAVSRAANVLKIFVDGVAYYTGTVTQSFSAVNTANPLRIGLGYYGPGASYTNPEYFPGYIDDVRITKGICRYNSSFTPPTAPFSNSPPNTWYDLSGNGNNATLVNGPTYSSANGGTIGFDGINDAVVIPISSSLQSSFFTDDVWIKFNNTSNQMIFSSLYQGYGTVSGTVFILYNNTYVFQSRLNNSCCQDLAYGSGNIGVWINFSITWDGTVKKLYCNGVLVASQTISGTHSQFNNFVIGNDADQIAAGNYGNVPLNGNVATFKHYNRALSALEVQQNYNALKKRFCPPQAQSLLPISPPVLVTDGLALYLDASNSSSYPGSGTTWYDLSGNGNNATLVNGPTYDSANGGNIALSAAGSQYISLSNMSSYLTGVTQFSYSTFIKVTSIQTLGTIFSFGSGGNYSNDMIFYYDSGGGLDLQVNNGADGGTGLAHNYGSWDNIVVVYDGTQSLNENRLVLYINGIRQTLSNGYTVPSTTSGIAYPISWIGGYSTAGVSNTFITGNISQVLLYTKALSSQEVQQNYNTFKDKFGL